MAQSPSKKDLLQPVDDDARRSAKEIVRTARFAALATLSPSHGGPMVSRVNVATTMDGSLFFLISGLSAHFKALVADNRASLLVGEPGKGDPMAHPRMTLNGQAHRVGDAALRDRLQERYLARHPKAKLYVDLPDFAFWQFEASEIAYNGGFARAYAPQPSDLLVDMSAVEGLADMEASAVEHMNDDHQDAIDHYAKILGHNTSGWRLTGLDPEGLDLMKGESAARLWFDAPLTQASQLRPTLVELARSGRDD